ncbi:hypothetical protein ABPG74_002587 [Tetrahymena malaccensis]
MLIQKLDLFSQNFQFNFGNQQSKKATVIGCFLSVIVVLTALAYFFYMINQYATNQLQPNFKQQSYVSEQNIELDINNDLIAYRFNYGKPQLNNQTYFVVLAFFVQKFNNNSTTIPLNMTNCSHPSLVGYQCFDLSNIPYTKINFDSKNNIQSQIRIFTYGCRDIDLLKRQEGVNCASQNDIDSMIDHYGSSITLKLFTSQYNTTSQQMQSNYRNLGMPTNSNLNVVSQIKAQKLVTTVKQGVFVQSSKIKSQQEDIEFKIDYEREDNFLESAIVPEFNNKMKKPLDARKSDIQNYYSSKGTSLNQSISQKKQDNTQNQTQQEVRFFSVEENAFNLESPALAMQNLNKKSSNINNMFLDSPIQQSVQKIQDCSSKQLSPKSASKRSIIQPNFKKTTTKQSALIKEATQAQKQRRQSDEYEFAVKKLQIIQDSNISSKVQNMAQKIVWYNLFLNQQIKK